MIFPLMIGATEILLLGGLALLLFGGKKLPEMMRGLGQGVKEFKQGMSDSTTPNEKTPEVPEQDMLHDHQDNKSEK